jgi:hypothetical protein
VAQAGEPTTTLSRQSRVVIEDHTTQTGSSIMSVNTEIRPLADAELDEVNGGYVAAYLQAFAVGFGLGYAIARAHQGGIQGQMLAMHGVEINF